MPGRWAARHHCSIDGVGRFLGWEGRRRLAERPPVKGGGQGTV
jgi:hypothetical protein